MPFAAGSVSFRRFAVLGDSPETADQALLDKLAAHLLRPQEMGVPEELEYGFSGGRHVLDAQLSFEKNVFADCISFGLRIDTNRVPSELKKAHLLMEEEAVAAGNPSGFISKVQKKQVKDNIQRQMEEELRSGRFRRSKLVPLLWDVPNRTLYTPATGKAEEMLMEIFERAAGLNLEPLTAGSIALKYLEKRGRRRDYEDARPTRFVSGPEGEGQYPEYPWCAKGDSPKDFFGNEFLLWLWHEADVREGSIQTEGAGNVTLFIDKLLELDCAYGQTGKDSLRGDGPARMPEARDGLKSGKMPRRLGAILDAFKQQSTFTFTAESFGLSGAKLPEVEEAENPRVLFEERIALLRDVCKAVDALYEAFLKLRCSSNWEGQTAGIRRWITQSAKAIAQVA